MNEERTSETTLYATLAEVMTASEAAQEWGLAEATVRRAINRGSLTARKSAGTWLVTVTEVESYFGMKHTMRVNIVETEQPEEWAVGRSIKSRMIFDPDSGQLDVIQLATGTGQTLAEFNRVVLGVTWEGCPTREQVLEFVEEHGDLFDAIMKGHETDVVNGDHVGILTENAENAWEAICELLERDLALDTESVIDAETYLGGLTPEELREMVADYDSVAAWAKSMVANEEYFRIIGGADALVNEYHEMTQAEEE